MNKKVVEAYASKLATQHGRRVPLREARAEIFEVIQRVARHVSTRFVFGYHDRADMEQEGIMLALEVLDVDPPKYDARRPLENFIHVHIRNQLSNLKRRTFNRPEPPCSCCDPFDPPDEPCEKWLAWSRRNITKQNIMRPLDMSRVSDDSEPGMMTASSAQDDAVIREIRDKIDEALSPDLRSDYLRMLENVPVPKARRSRVREAVLAIIAEEESDGS